MFMFQKYLQNQLRTIILHFDKNQFIIQASFNFSSVITKPADGTWGNPRGNGSWTGIIGHLQNQETDVGNDFFSKNLVGHA